MLGTEFITGAIMKITKTGSLELLIAKQERQRQKLIYVIQHDACCMEAQTKGRVAQEARNLLEKGGDSQGRHLGRAQVTRRTREHVARSKGFKETRITLAL